MLDLVSKLFENNVISESTKSEIEKAWSSKVKEHHDQVSKKLREEYAKKYEHDKTQMTEAVESMLADRLNEELSEFAEDRKKLLEARSQYRKKMKRDVKAMESFILSNLKKEINELREDRKQVANNVKKIELFVVESLAKEITEFHIDKRDLTETKIRVIKEGKQKFNELKREFIKRASVRIDEAISKGLRKEIRQLKEDIDTARKSDFGRRIFESFASEYAASHLNEKSEANKLRQLMKKRDAMLKQSEALLTKQKHIVEAKDREIRKLSANQHRKEIMHELLSPLKHDKREIMGELLESVRTDRLRSAYEKYLPSVIDGHRPKKQSLNENLTESKEINGNRSRNNDKPAEIIDIRRLAGIY